MQEYADINRSVMLDGNALAGLLREIFTTEMTVSPAQCAHCGREGALGSLLAFMQGPGVILRCPACEQVVLRITRVTDRYYLDARGATFVCIPLGN
jgi:hypothetical protein